MKPIKFNQANCTFAKNQSALPAHTNVDGTVTSCWTLTFLERIKVLFTGKIWLQLLSFNKPLTPSKLSINNPLK